MTRLIPVLALTMALAACTASGTASVTTPGASSKPQAGSSAKPSTAPSGGASTAPAATGESTVALTIDGKAVALDGAFKWSNTDLMGKRFRGGGSIGDDANPQKGHGTVGFLFSAGGTGMFPGFDVKDSATVASAQLFWVDPDANQGRQYNIDFKSREGATMTAADGHIKGGYDGKLKAQRSSEATPEVESTVVLTFDLVQPPVK